MAQVLDSSTIVARGPLAWESLGATEPRRLWRFVLPALITLACLTGLNTPLPYYAQEPGGATPVNPLVGLPADRAHAAKGRFLLTTVSLQYRPTVLESIRGWLDPDIDVYPEEVLLGDRTVEQFRQVNIQDIDNSKDVAIAVALRRLGFEVQQTGGGALVENVRAGAPARAFLFPGDVIVAAGGQPVALVEDVIKVVATRQPGELLPVEVQAPDGTRRSVQVPLIPCPPDVACPPGGNAVMGVGLRTRDEQFQLPFDVTIESEDIGGPSAGLAFALTVIDMLTTGELTGAPDGRTIAVTGTIDIDGNVGPIGGVRQKAAAVAAAGIDYFLVPAGNFEDAQSRAGDDLQVIPVTNLDSALAALAELGGVLGSVGPPP